MIQPRTFAAGRLLVPTAPRGERKLISIREAAQLAGMPEITLRRLIARDRLNAGVTTTGDLAACVVDLPGSRLLVRRAAFERWLGAEPE